MTDRAIMYICNIIIMIFTITISTIQWKSIIRTLAFSASVNIYIIAFFTLI